MVWGLERRGVQWVGQIFGFFLGLSFELDFQFRLGYFYEEKIELERQYVFWSIRF